METPETPESKLELFKQITKMVSRIAETHHIEEQEVLDKMGKLIALYYNAKCFGHILVICHKDEKTADYKIINEIDKILPKIKFDL